MSPEKVTIPTRTRLWSRLAISASAAATSAARIVSLGSVETVSGGNEPGSSSSSCGLKPTSPSRSTSTPLATLVEPETSIARITSKSAGRSPSVVALPRIGA